MFSRSPARNVLVGLGGVLLVILTLRLTASVPNTPMKPKHPRGKLFGTLAPSITEALNGRDRMTVLFYPGVGQCKSQELAAIRALRRIGRDTPDIPVLTVLPASLMPAARFGEEPPGKVVRVRDERFHAETRVAPTPRVEVWSSTGQLLLMRSLPSNASEDEIYEQVLWSRSFTAPSEPRGRRVDTARP